MIIGAWGSVSGDVLAAFNVKALLLPWRVACLLLRSVKT